MVAFSDTSQSHPLRVTRDHVIPRVHHGGEEDEGNIVLCCRTCNHIKGSMNPSEWEAYRLACPEWWNDATMKRRLQ
jgi:5-methylcytosine-specific restriction endonuclease McrA